MLTLNQLSYIHTNGDVLFDDINLTVNTGQKIALIGNNGTGKSTLLKILIGQLNPSDGKVMTTSQPYYVPQHVGQFDELTIAQALGINHKLIALNEIMTGDATEKNLLILNDDWLLEERCHEAFARWNLIDVELNRKMGSLSGGQKTKVFLAGITIHRPELVLLDEPSNHLDTLSRDRLYEYIRTTSNTLVVVSHDKKLLNLLDLTLELRKHGLSVYGGNYDFYSEQKKTESDALIQNLKSKEKELRKAKDVERESLERKQKLDARGKKKQEKAGLPTISMNTFKNNAEKSASRIKDVHTEKTEALANDLSQLRAALPDEDRMKMNLANARILKGKKLIEAHDINFDRDNRWLWQHPLNFQISSGERIAITGSNGSGKTTLVRLMLGEYEPQSGIINRALFNFIYVDQDYSLINNKLTVYQQAQQFNSNELLEHEIKIRLNRFLFEKEAWDKLCSSLSGGEKMRLTLCCLMMANYAPDVIALDEPTNNLDIQNSKILSSAIRDYNGTLIVISHDHSFLKDINIDRQISL